MSIGKDEVIHSDLYVAGGQIRIAGTIEGDLVVVRSQDHAQDGDIVVALVGEEATVKRFFQSDFLRITSMARPL